jgi:hypothetical protein
MPSRGFRGTVEHSNSNSLFRPYSSLLAVLIILLQLEHDRNGGSRFHEGENIQNINGSYEVKIVALSGGVKQLLHKL